MELSVDAIMIEDLRRKREVHAQMPSKDTNKRFGA